MPVDVVPSRSWEHAVGECRVAEDVKEDVKEEGGHRGHILADGSKTLADYSITSGMTLYLDVPCDVKVVACDAGMTCEV